MNKKLRKTKENIKKSAFLAQLIKIFFIHFSVFMTQVLIYLFFLIYISFILFVSLFFSFAFISSLRPSSFYCLFFNFSIFSLLVSVSVFLSFYIFPTIFMFLFCFHFAILILSQLMRVLIFSFLNFSSLHSPNENFMVFFSFLYLFLNFPFYLIKNHNPN